MCATGQCHETAARLEAVLSVYGHALAFLPDARQAIKVAATCGCLQALYRCIAGVRSMAFSANGDCLLAAGQDGLKVWAWEPIRRLDTVDIPWAKVSSLHVLTRLQSEDEVFYKILPAASHHAACPVPCAAITAARYRFCPAHTAYINASAHAALRNTHNKPKCIAVQCCMCPGMHL